MREHSDYNSYSYNCTGVIEQEGTAIHCYGGMYMVLWICGKLCLFL